MLGTIITWFTKYKWNIFEENVSKEEVGINMSLEKKHQSENMSALILKSVKREERERDGFSSFKECVEAPNHIYIEHSIRKYLNDFNKKDSIWCNPFMTFDLSRE